MYYINACHAPRFMRDYRFADRVSGSDSPVDYNRTFRPRADISENETQLFMDFDLPGIEKEDVRISVNEEGILKIEAKKKQPESSEEKKYFRNERYFGDYVRSFQLPENISRDNISAKFENGVLRLTLTKIRPSEHVVDIK